MTAPSVDRGPMIPVMAFMQGPGLLVLAPLILSFFAGGTILSISLANSGVVSRWNVRLHEIAVAIAVIGGVLATSAFVSARVVGLACLGTISVAQAWAGLGLRADARRATVHPRGNDKMPAMMPRHASRKAHV